MAQGNDMAVASLIVSVISLVFAGAALFISWRKHVKDREYANDKELLEQLKQSLELAFRSLASEDNMRPVSDRMRWLTAARHIARFRKLQNGLSTILYRTICEEQEEYWRNRIYVLLEKIENSSFYEVIDPDKMVPERIEPRSAAIVHSFSVWKEGRADPLDDMSFEEIVRNYKLFSARHHPFRDYIVASYPQLAENEW
jgi:hypothetical protein